MKLITFTSGSKGNCYLLDNGKEALVIECGLKFFYVKKQLNYDVKRVVGCIVSHKHKDHAGEMASYMQCGVPVFRPYYDAEARQSRKYGNFTIISFPCVHDVPCCGFIILHPEMGKMLYATDTGYIKFCFEGVNHMLIECNHDAELLKEWAVNFEHSLTGHMSIETCREFVKKNDSRLLKNVVLCHMSDENIVENMAIAKIKEVTKANVWSAHTDKEIDLRLTPF